tara:strand:- start:747 stop:1877 length:1131 start_codon:yes stop_codon:yes gene_type:complete
MKKSKLLRKIAYPDVPQHADGFVPPAGHTFKMSVNLRGVSIKIYGFDGSSWTMIHDTDGLISDFITDVIYQKYYFESKTGSVQTVRVSFLSSENAEDVHNFELAVTDDTRKLYHFDDVPVYRGNDEGKFLTIMSDGTLRWLAEGESYTVESEGGEGGESPAQPNFLNLLERLPNPGILTDNGHGMDHMIRFRLNNDNIIAYGDDGQPVDEEFTISWWMKLNNSQAANSISILGQDSPKRFSMNMTAAKTNGIPNPNIQVRIGNQYIFNNGIGVAMGGNWIHCAITCKSNGSNLVVSVYIDGNKLPSSRSFALGSKLLPSAANDLFSFGGSGQSGKSAKGQFDSIQIEGGIALTDEQVAAIAAQTDRLMGIESASQI